MCPAPGEAGAADSLKLEDTNRARGIVGKHRNQAALEQSDDVGVFEAEFRGGGINGATGERAPADGQALDFAEIAGLEAVAALQKRLSGDDGAQPGGIRPAEMGEGFVFVPLGEVDELAAGMPGAVGRAGEKAGIGKPDKTGGGGFLELAPHGGAGR